MSDESMSELKSYVVNYDVEFVVKTKSISQRLLLEPITVIQV